MGGVAALQMAFPGSRGRDAGPAGVTLPIFTEFGGWWGLVVTWCLLPREQQTSNTELCPQPCPRGACML